MSQAFASAMTAITQNSAKSTKKTRSYLLWKCRYEVVTAGRADASRNTVSAIVGEGNAALLASVLTA